MKHKVIIIGSGPAGLTAAVYAGRANMNPVVLEGMAEDHQPGGQLMITTEVENYPGFPHGVTGPKLMEMMRAQAERFGTTFFTEDAIKVELHGPVKRVWLDSQPEPLEAPTVIIATGAVAKWSGAPGEKALQNYGVSACATCDGSFFKEQDVIVVGGGDTAMEEAHYLTNMCRSVTVVHRRDRFRSEKILADRLMERVAAGKMTVLWNHEVDEVLGDATGVTGLRVKATDGSGTKDLSVTGVFIAVGHQPNTQLFEGQLEMKGGYLQVKSGLAGEATMTSVPGVFAAGDVADHTYRQAITSAGTGCMAALDADRWLDHQDAQRNAKA
jgi:thioredoxin reductase (NADPH)